MSDEALRELERRWLAGRDPRDESAFLVERLRTRRLARSRVEIVAYLGHGPAMDALQGGAPVGEHVPWLRWRRSLDESARVPLIRLALALVERDLRGVTALPDAISAALTCARSLLRCPCAPHADEARALADVGVQQDPGQFEAFVAGMHLDSILAATAAPLLRTPEKPDPLYSLLHSLWRARNGTELDEAGSTGRQALVQWALGPDHSFVSAPVVDERTYLADRLRRGELRQDRLEIAAYAGCEVARALVPVPAEVPVDRTAWVLGLARWSPDWVRRVIAHVAGEELGRRWAFPAQAPSREVFRVLADEFKARREASHELRGWADNGRARVRSCLATLQRFVDHPAIADQAEALCALRQLVAVLTCIRDDSLPQRELIDELVTAHERKWPSDFVGLVKSWALRCDSGSRHEWLEVRSKLEAQTAIGGAPPEATIGDGVRSAVDDANLPPR